MEILFSNCFTANKQVILLPRLKAQIFLEGL